ncbi:MAG: hypothetical protein COU69_04170 [Candidatus Pacebacteria bacterium CG10_big_fil_rev_8_21_14_0_10_56_10]|nr:MAG: hypothetical protein COU69_04170 [Candidatus Pacebacteria bacterium CG10_big_fil_rev_8_21_14_0_10_56_10]
MIKNLSVPAQTAVIVLAVGVAILGTVLAVSLGRPPAEQDQLAERCQQRGGTWLSEFNECEHVDSQACDDLGGSFQSCASACRHDPQAEVCTEQCEPVCSFGSTFSAEPQRFNGSLQGLPTAPPPDLSASPEIVPEGGVD